MQKDGREWFDNVFFWVKIKHDVQAIRYGIIQRFDHNLTPAISQGVSPIYLYTPCIHNGY